MYPGSHVRALITTSFRVFFEDKSDTSILRTVSRQIFNKPEFLPEVMEYVQRNDMPYGLKYILIDTSATNSSSKDTFPSRVRDGKAGERKGLC